MDRRDLAEWACILLIAAGAFWAWPPAGLIVLGALGLLWLIFGAEDGNGAE